MKQIRKLFPFVIILFFIISNHAFAQETGNCKFNVEWKIEDGTITFYAADPNEPAYWRNRDCARSFQNREDIKKVIIQDEMICDNLQGSIFQGCKYVKEMDLKKLKFTDDITNMSEMFSGCTSLEKLDLSGWNTSHVTTMYRMFMGCSSLQELNLNDWDTSKVSNMVDMFNNCSVLTNLDLSGFVTSSTTKTSNMFSGCSKLKSINFDNWVTNNVTEMQSMFYGCTGLENLDLHNLSTAAVTNMANMFQDCTNLKSLDLHGWNTANVTDMNRMFYGCSNLTDLNISGWNTPKVKDISRMFRDCQKLTYLDLSGWNSSAMTSYSTAFYRCNTLNTLKLGQNTMNNFQIFASLPKVAASWYYIAQGTEASDPLNLGTVKSKYTLFNDYNYTKMAGTWTTDPEIVLITFDSNGGTGSMEPQSVLSGIATTLNPNNFIRENHSFTGWNTCADSTGTGCVSYEDKDTVTVDAPMTLYAQWIEPAASIGSTLYPTLKEALDAAEDRDTIKILKNIEEPNASNEREDSDITMTIDLNGFDVEFGAIHLNANLYILDNSTKGGGTLNTEINNNDLDDYFCLYVMSNVSVTVTGVQWLPNSIDVSNSATLTLKNSILLGGEDFDLTISDEARVVLDKVIVSAKSGEWVQYGMQYYAPGGKTVVVYEGDDAYPSECQSPAECEEEGVLDIADGKLACSMILMNYPRYNISYTFDNSDDTITGTAPNDLRSPYKTGSTVKVLGNIGREHAFDDEFDPPLVKTGYDFSGWTMTADGTGPVYSPEGENKTFTMGEEDVTLYALWKAIDYKITIVTEGQGSVTATPAGTEDTPAHFKDTVTLTLKPEIGHVLKELSVKQGDDPISYDISGQSFLMPAGDVIVTAVFSPHVHEFVYSAEGGVMTAVCQNSDGGHDGDTHAYLTLSAPADLIYDDTEKTASYTVSPEDSDAFGAPFIVYKQNDVICGAVPKNAGTYTAEITIDGKTAQVEFTIEKEEATVKAADQIINRGENIKTGIDLAKLTGAIEGHRLSEITLKASDISSYADKGEIIPSNAVILDEDNKNVTDNYSISYVNGILTVTGEKPEPEYSESLDFFRLCEHCRLPATGFPTRHVTSLLEKPEDLNYKPIRMHLQIPVLNVETELVTVPLTDDSWSVEWLSNHAGVLEGSTLPGKGISVIAAHNTLNSTEAGPFALLSLLKNNDLIVVNTKGGSLMSYRVYANALIAPDDMNTLASIAGQEDDLLILVTCEDESDEGGYLNRRVIFAKPL